MVYCCRNGLEMYSSSLVGVEILTNIYYVKLAVGSK